MVHIPGGEGEGGVFVCRIDAGKRDKHGEINDGDEVRVVVVKGSGSRIACEIFASLFAQRMAILCPLVELVEWQPSNPADTRHDDIVNGIIGLAEAGQTEGMSLLLAAQKQLNKAFFLLMEWVESDCTLASLAEHIVIVGASTDRAHNLLSDLLNMGEHTGRRYWHDIGQMMVMDVILNEFDRVPGFFENTGNAGNILFQFSTGRCVAIDQSLRSIHGNVHPEACQAHMDRTRQFLHEHERVTEALSCPTTSPHVRRQWTRDAPMIANAVHWLMDYLPSTPTLQHLGLHIDQSAIRDHIARELNRGISAAVHSVKKITLKHVDDMRRQVMHMKTGKDWENIYQHSVRGIHVSFVWTALQTVSQYNRGSCCTGGTAVLAQSQS